MSNFWLSVLNPTNIPQFLQRYVVLTAILYQAITQPYGRKLDIYAIHNCFYTNSIIPFLNFINLSSDEGHPPNLPLCCNVAGERDEVLTAFVREYACSSRVIN